MLLLDASALLAYLLDEPGADMIDTRLHESAICSVNLGEVATRIAARGGNPRDVLEETLDSGLDVYDFTYTSSLRLIEVNEVERAMGVTLSLGDRCCLATALAEELPLLTADREWARFGDVIDVRLIR